MARFIEGCVHGKLNILVCGGTGSGKTTLLNIVSSFIENHENQLFCPILLKNPVISIL